MKKTIITTLAIAGLGTLGIVAIAQTQGPGGFEPSERFERMDVNGDGVLNQADRDARKAERFASADTNGDNLVSQDEFIAGMEAERERRRAERQARMFEKADADGDGFITAEEHAAVKAPKRMAKMFKRADANGDGEITADEHAAFAEKMKDRRGKRKGRHGGER